jgi:type VI secretion system protein ImpG
MDKYYQLELERLRSLSVEFSQAHPALAPMLSGPSQDPDVERLLEGTAFLSGLLRQKLDDSFPELIHGLMNMVFPHYLRPIPAATIVVFEPQPGLTESREIPAGIELASVSVEGTQCLFRTCYNVEIHPLEMVDVRFEHQPGKAGLLSLHLKLRDVPLNNWKVNRLRFHLAGSFSNAASLWSLFFNYMDKITVSPDDGEGSLVLGPGAIRAIGFGRNEGLFPYPAHAFRGYRAIQELFILPEKFLFFDVVGLDAWRNRGDGSNFRINFQLKEVPSWMPRVKRDSFSLFATPVINLFSYEAEPIDLNHRKPEYRVYPAGKNDAHYQVFSVDSVIGYSVGSLQRRKYQAFELFSNKRSESPLYSVKQQPSVAHDGTDVLLSIVYPPRVGVLEKETLALKLTCTNAFLPENLQLRDIHLPTRSSPNLCKFYNIRALTAPIQPPMGGNLLWRFFSHLSLNLLSLGNTENLKSLLKIYVFPSSHDRATIVANQRRIEGIDKFETQTVNRIIQGLLMRGQELSLEINSNHFGSFGDMFLFGSVMDFFLGAYSSINSFTQLKVTDTNTGDAIRWPVRIGERPLI